MRRTYSKLFSINLLHDYYTNNQTRDFEIIPTANTRNLMIKYRMLMKKHTNGLKVYYEGPNQGIATIPVDDDLKFVFYLKLDQPRFLNFTNLPLKNSNKEKYHFSNQDHTGSELPLTQTQYELYQHVINHEFSQIDDDSTVEIKVYDQDNNLVLTGDFDPYKSEDGPDSGETTYNYAAQLDLSGLPPGLYDIKHTGLASLDKTVYVDSGISMLGVFGIVELTISDQQDCDFIYQFEKRFDTWKYFIALTENTETGTDLTVEHKYGTYTFSLQDPIQELEDVATESSILASMPDGSVVLLFYSDTQIDYTEAPKTGIKLVRDLTETVLNNLSNPATSNPKPEIIIYAD